MNETIKNTIARTKAYLYLECGKCTATCPIVLRRPARMTPRQTAVGLGSGGPEFTPRSFVEHIIKRADESLIYNFLWRCLTCKMCEEPCPSDVRFIELIRTVRSES